jgi:hypothetical protein
MIDVSIVASSPVNVQAGNQNGTSVATGSTIVPYGTMDHSQLENRDALEQHPMASISGLVADLSTRLTADSLGEEITELTNSEILSIWNSIQV